MGVAPGEGVWHEGGGTMHGEAVGDGDGQAAPVDKRHGVAVGVGTGLGGGDQHAFIGG